MPKFTFVQIKGLPRRQYPGEAVVTGVGRLYVIKIDDVTIWVEPDELQYVQTEEVE